MPDAFWTIFGMFLSLCCVAALLRFGYRLFHGTLFRRLGIGSRRDRQ